MPILSNQLKYYKSSSGVGLGGPITPTQIPDGSLNNLFDDVSASEALAGDIEYRCLYVKNENASIDLLQSIVFIEAQTSSVDTSIEIGLGTSGVNGSEQVIPNESTEPAGIAWESDIGEAYGLLIGDLPQNGGYFPIWVKRVIGSNALATSSDISTITVQGETTA